MHIVSKHISVCILLFIAFNNVLRAQISLNTSGSNLSGFNGSVSQSIGQVLYTTVIGEGGCVEQGVQHPYEVVLLDITLAGESVFTKVYPNPTSESLILEVVHFSPSIHSYELTNIRGETLHSEFVNSQYTHIDASKLPVGMFFLSIFSAEHFPLQTFKILKN
jgi:hypothetical protein